MKVYLAARYGRRDELRRYAADLMTHGHQVTSRWLAGQHEAGDPNQPEGTIDEQGEWAKEDMADIHRADALIAFTEAVDSPYSRGGRHVELGVALGYGLHCLVVGPRENVFHCLPEVAWYRDWASALEALS